MTNLAVPIQALKEWWGRGRKGTPASYSSPPEVCDDHRRARAQRIESALTDARDATTLIETYTRRLTRIMEGHGRDS
jgi:hypothetical protein